MKDEIYSLAKKSRIKKNRRKANSVEKRQFTKLTYSEVNDLFRANDERGDIYVRLKNGKYYIHIIELSNYRDSDIWDYYHLDKPWTGWKSGL